MQETPTIKLAYKGRTKKTHLSFPLSYPDILSLTARLFPESCAKEVVEAPKFEYLDSEGDWIFIEGEKEIEDSIDWFIEGGARTLKMNILVPQDPPPAPETIKAPKEHENTANEIRRLSGELELMRKELSDLKAAITKNVCSLCKGSSETSSHQKLPQKEIPVQIPAQYFPPAANNLNSSSSPPYSNPGGYYQHNSQSQPSYPPPSPQQQQQIAGHQIYNHPQPFTSNSNTGPNSLPLPMNWR